MIRIDSCDLKEIREEIDRDLRKRLKTSSKYQEELVDSMSYSLFSGGKRLRPRFAIKTFLIFDNDIEKIMPYASAIEFIHTYSLIHDDLPAMDNDSLRRGKATNHVKFGQAMAILAGDSLLNLAYETMLEDIRNFIGDEKESKARLEAAALISEAAGISGMIGGQVIDIRASRPKMDLDKLLYMYERKTAALFRAAILSAGIIGGASLKEIQILEDFARLFGLAYQIQDDLMDVDRDEKISKITYLFFVNEEKARKDFHDMIDQGISQLKKLEGRDISFLLELIEGLRKREI